MNQNKLPAAPEGSTDRLTERDYWQSLYEANPRLPAAPPAPESHGPMARLLCRIGGIDSLSAIYPDHQFWNVILPKYLQQSTTARVIEIGSAPGDNLVEIHRRFGYEPFGVEYTPTGAEESRQTLTAAGFPDHVFECDAFSEEFQRRHQGTFDVVISMGFIEHFTDVESVIRHHVNLLAPGGTLIIRIPRLRGVNYALARLIDPTCLPLHNLTIMTRKRYRELFRDVPLRQLFCDYQGSMHLTIVDKPTSKFGQLFLSLARKVQVFATIAMFRLLAGRSVESVAFSPFLLYIGRRDS
jgi:2-polyprenyl-3-methyl-5-hydroxy-6-metoxy-1,4-benzoquinol methylase